MSTNTKWSTVMNKKSPKTNETKRTTLKDHCIFSFIGTCNNHRCTKSHNENRQLQNIAKNPLNIFDLDTQSQIKKSISDSLNNEKPIFFTSCSFCFRNIPCHNVIAGRIVKFDTTFNNKNTSMYACYPEISTCKNKIPCGFHYDIEYNGIGRDFEIIRVISPYD